MNAMDLRPYIEGRRRRAADERKRTESKRLRLVRILRKVAPKIAEEFGLRRVWLFGSWAWGTPHRRSDVDVAVEGLAPGKWIDAWGRMDELLRAIAGDRTSEADLRQVETFPDWARAKIVSKGILLYARE